MEQLLKLFLVIFIVFLVFVIVIKTKYNLKKSQSTDGIELIKFNSVELQELNYKGHTYIGVLNRSYPNTNFLTHAGYCPCNSK